MLFAALTIAGMGVLPIHASDKSEFRHAFGNPCTPTLDAYKRCAPNTMTGAPTYWFCNGKERTWEPTNERCGTVIPKTDTPPTPDGDWHIGCDNPGHCGYYQDHSHKRSVDPNSDTLAGSIEAGSSIQKTPDWLNLPDRDGLDTRCSLTGIDLVEKFDGQQWVHHYKCPAGTSCADILGSGACKAGKHDFTIPGRSYLWVFNCPDAPKDSSTCQFSESMHVYGSPKPHEPYLTGTTRCNPNGRAVQYRDGKKWRDVYSCNTGAACVEYEGRAGCQAGQSLAYPLKLRSLPSKRQDAPGVSIEWPTLQRDEEDQPPTRCNPDAHGHVQFFSEYYHKWVDFHTCEFNGGCYNWKGKALCNDDNVIVVPFVELPNGVEGWHPIKHEEEDSVLPPVQQKLATTQFPIHTRCDPEDTRQKIVQYLHPAAQQWLRFYECHGQCVLFPEFAACEEHRDKYVVPSPPTPDYQQSVARRDLDPPLHPLANGGWGSRCDTSRHSGVTAFFRGKTVAHGECPDKGACSESDIGFAVCHVNGYPYLMGAHGQTAYIPRQGLYTPSKPDFHTFDTRCNPADFNEVQRHNGSHWVHHFTCTFRNSCIDVDGHGACRLQDNVYELPAANHTSVQQGEPVNPLRVKTRCIQSNASQILEWKGHSWEPRGVCLPPYECFDFAGAADFALCALPNNQPSSKLFLPWPALSRSTNSGQVTRCMDENMVEQFKDNTWIPFNRCTGIFKCRDAEGSSNGGCSVSNLSEILWLAGVDRAIADASRDTPSRLPKRNEVDVGLLKHSQQLEEQGRVLIDEGEDLTAQSDSLLESFFGPRDTTVTYNNLAAMENLAPSNDTDIDTDTDTHTHTDAFANASTDVPTDAHTGDDTDADAGTPSSLTRLKDSSVPNTSLVPTATNPAIRRRGTSGLVDDSMGLHKQGQHLVEEGNKLVDQGRKLLKTLFGDGTEEYIKNITQRHRNAVVAEGPIVTQSPDAWNASDVLNVNAYVHDDDARDEDSGSETE